MQHFFGEHGKQSAILAPARGARRPPWAPSTVFFLGIIPMPKMYGWVREVVPESPADLAGLQPGDLIRTINGNLIRDLVDYRFYVADEELTIGFERQQGQHEVRITKSIDESLGVLFGEEPAPFIRQCANKCVFCFIKGLPERFAPKPA